MKLKPILFLVLVIISMNIVYSQQQQYITIHIDLTRANYSSGIIAIGEDMGIAYIGWLRYYYCPGYFDMISFNVSGGANSYVRLAFVYGIPLQLGFNIVINGTTLTVDNNTYTITGDWTIEVRWINATDKDIVVYDANGVVYAIRTKGFRLMLLDSWRIHITVPYWWFNSYFKLLKNIANAPGKYADLLFESPIVLLYATFDHSTLYLWYVILPTGEYFLETYDYGVDIVGLWGRQEVSHITIYVYLENGTMARRYVHIDRPVNVYTILGMYTPPLPPPPAPPTPPETPQPPDIPSIPEPPPWYDVPGWMTYVRDRVADFFGRILPSALGFANYIVTVGKGLWSLLGISAFILTIIFVGLPAILGIMSMIYITTGEFDKATKMWLYYVEFLLKIVRFIWRIFRGLISIIMKLIDIISGPFT